MTLVRTEQRVLDALSNATRRRVTAAQLQKQRVSYIMSSFDGDQHITKEKVERELRKLDGQPA